MQEKTIFRKVRKRDGKIADFDSERIAKAIFKAFQSADEGSIRDAERLAPEVVRLLAEKLPDGSIPTVE